MSTLTIGKTTLTGDRTILWPDSSGTVSLGGGGLTNFTDGISTASPNGTVPVVSLTATNAATNVDIALKPKGSGALSAHIADSTSTGGNKRNGWCVDWQMSRNNANQVASSSYATLSGGDQNRVAGDYGTVGGGSANAISGGSYGCIPGGQGNTVSANYAFSAGRTNTSSAQYTTTLGVSCTASGTASIAMGSGAVASGENSYACGENCSTRGVRAAFVESAGQLATAGDAQGGRYYLRKRTTNNTPIAVTSDAGAASSTNQIILPNASVFGFFGQITVRETATGDSKTIDFRGSIKRGANAAATALQGTVTQLDLGTPDAGLAAATVAFTADTTNGGLAITVTGETAKNLQWVAVVHTVENVY